MAFFLPVKVVILIITVVKTPIQQNTMSAGQIVWDESTIGGLLHTKQSTFK